MHKVIGLDFGTTNSAIALATPDGKTVLATFGEEGQRTATFRSVLYFDPENVEPTGRPRAPPSGYPDSPPGVAQQPVSRDGLIQRSASSASVTFSSIFAIFANDSLYSSLSVIGTLNSEPRRSLIFGSLTNKTPLDNSAVASCTLIVQRSGTIRSKGP